MSTCTFEVTMGSTATVQPENITYKSLCEIYWPVLRTLF